MFTPGVWGQKKRCFPSERQGVQRALTRVRGAAQRSFRFCPSRIRSYSTAGYNSTVVSDWKNETNKQIEGAYQHLWYACSSIFCLVQRQSHSPTPLVSGLLLLLLLCRSHWRKIAEPRNQHQHPSQLDNLIPRLAHDCQQPPPSSRPAPPTSHGPAWPGAQADAPS